MQKSLVVPHCPQTLQHALRGHGLRLASSVVPAGLEVLGTCGPQTAVASGAGIGGDPVDKHITCPGWR
jgi:hypothetical protein